MFIYAHARAYCEREGMDLCLPPNVLEKIFDIPEAVRPPKSGLPDRVIPEQTFQNQDALIYTRKQVREWFRIKPHLLELLKPAKCKSQVILNQRVESDYIGSGMVVLGRQCYQDAARKHGYDPHNYDQVGYESDHSRTWLDDFQGDESASGLNTTWTALPSFYRLMTAPVLFRANSTFSWWSATLSDGQIYSPVIKGMRGGVPNQYCTTFVEGNWPVMCDNAPNTDLHLAE